MRIFVTGATGVLGRRVVPALLELGHEVTAVARSETRLAPLAARGAAVRTLNLFDPEAVQPATAQHDAVLNLATHVPPLCRLFWPGAWREMDRLRRDASAVLAMAAITSGVRRFVQGSFAPIYPDSGARWITESTLPSPARYNRSVLDAEAAAHRFHRASGPAVILRFAYFYGPNDPFSDQLITGAERGWLPLFGRRSAYLPLVTHDDAASAVLAALELPAGTYNVVDDEPLTHGEIARTLAEVLDTREPRLLPRWMAHLAGSAGETLARSLRVANHALRGCGWEPAVRSARQGLRLAAEARKA